VQGEVSRSHSRFRERAIIDRWRSHRRAEGLNEHRGQIGMNVHTCAKREIPGREQHHLKSLHKEIIRWMYYIKF